MKTHASLSRYILVILCVSIAFTALVLIALNSLMQNRKLSGASSGIVDQIFSNQAYENGYKAGYLAARDKFSKVAPLPEGAIVTSITGKVDSVDAKGVKLTVTNLDTDEYVDGVSNQRLALVTASTTIVTRSFLSAEEQAKQLERWSESGSKKAPPVPYTEKAINLSGIKPGDNVIAVANEDVRLKDSFNATQLIVNNN
jgi:hypothetical protein